MIGTECWKTYKLGDCVNFLSGGTPSKKNPEYWGGNIPWVSCKDMKKAYLYDSQDHITEKGAANGTRFVSPETILIVVRGMILGQHFPVAIAKRKMAFNQDLKALQCAPNVDPKFLFHWLRGKSYEILGIVDEAAHGTKRLQTDRLQNFPLHLPPLPIQRKIAAILSAYDDLIENNTRRIEILEEMARSIYREWFVKFRFPGHEQVQMVDSELGLIPEGWEVRNLSEICEIIMGLSPKSEFYNENAEGLPLHQGVTNFGVWFPTDKVYTTAITRLAQIGDILFSVRAPVGRINIANKTIVIGRGICAIRSKTGKQNFVLQQLKDKFYEDNLMGGGTIYPSVTKEEVQKIKMLVPFPEKILAFESQSLPIFRQIEVFLLKNRNLCQTRDLLLPRLISGEIDVENLDINTGEIAA